MIDIEHLNADALSLAREYEETYGDSIKSQERPCFHLSPRVGWMNDPNGFSFYGGKYHLFYQYHPYKSQWGPMHWGHAVSDDMVTWDYLPVALAPDKPYDQGGCFSGSAATLPDGRHLLMYTGVVVGERRPDGTIYTDQVQCLAVGDGTEYEKIDANPVLDGGDLPEGLVTRHFRDPKVWQEPDGTYRCVVGGRDEEKNGHVLVFSSPDGFSWSFDRELIANDGSFGRMWECPDYFELAGKKVLLTSPQDMLAQGNEFISGNGTLCIVGHEDETGRLVPETTHPVDYGIDFYATQTILTPDGRRVMVAWMQNWDTISMAGNRPWFGQMTIPRELFIRDDRLWQWPVRELDAYRTNYVAYKGLAFEGELVLPGVSGRRVDMTLSVRPQDESSPYEEFCVWFAQKGDFHSSLRFSPQDRILKLNRKHSGLRRAVVYHRKCEVFSYDGTLSLRIIIDRCSAEIFINHGSQAMSICIPTALDAQGITFFAQGKVLMDVENYELRS